MRFAIFVLSLLFGLAAPAAAQAQLGLSFSMPGLSIGINVPVYPQLERVPGYPVYYAPGLQTNFFFYDGLYWVYQGDDWYASDWYDGPWGRVSPQAVPLFVLRIPVRYYRSPPVYFRGWRDDAPPRWGDHWGNEWQRQRPGWDRWNRSAVPAPAPLPNYQRAYSAERYPRPEQQRDVRERNYRYQPREAVVRQHLQAQPAVRAPAPQREQRDDRPAAQPDRQRERRPERVPEPQAQRVPSEQSPRQQAPAEAARQPRRPEAAPEQGRPPGKGQQNQPAQREQGKPDPDRKDQGKGRDKGDERDNERNK